MNEKDRLIQFLKENTDLLIGHISIDYPLSDHFIEIHSNLLNWSDMVHNEKITYSIEFCKRHRDKIYWKDFTPSFFHVYHGDKYTLWNEVFLEEFKEVINWSSISYSEDNKLLTEKTISQFETYIDWFNFSSNPYFKFSEELIVKYTDKWDWSSISQNEELPWDERFILKFVNKWDWKQIRYNRGIPWTKKILDKIGEYLEEKDLKELRIFCIETGQSFNHRYPIREKFKKRNIEIYSENEFQEILKNFDAVERSDDVRIPWTSGLIEYYKNEWDWEKLSSNELLPWSEDLIDAYLNKWFWGSIVPDPDSGIEGYQTSTIYKGVTNIESIHWTHRMINKYEDYLFWDYFCLNQSIEWTFNLLEEYYHLFNPDRLTQSRKLWEKVFYPYLNEEIISKILDSVNKNNKKSGIPIIM